MPDPRLALALQATAGASAPPTTGAAFVDARAPMVVRATAGLAASGSA